MCDLVEHGSLGAEELGEVVGAEAHVLAVELRVHAALCSAHTHTHTHIN